MKFRRIIATTLIVSSLATVTGCAWFQANGKTVVTDVGQIAACVLSQVLNPGTTDANQVIQACQGATLADLVGVLGSLIDFYTAPPAAGEKRPALDADTLMRLYSLKAQAEHELAK